MKDELAAAYETIERLKERIADLEGVAKPAPTVKRAPDLLSAVLKAMDDAGVDFDFAVRITRPNLGTFSVHGSRTVPQVVAAICHCCDMTFIGDEFRPRGTSCKA